MSLNRQQLLDQRGDLSQFLFHLTRAGTLKRSKDLYALPVDDFVPLMANSSLEGILTNRRIEARSAFGYFNYKIRLVRQNGTIANGASTIQRDWLKSVCFTETPIDHVNLQMGNISGRQLHFQPYGLAFREKVVRQRNGNPVLYVQTTNHAARLALDKMAEAPNSQEFRAMMPLVEGFGPPWFPTQFGPSDIDFRWEREWRVCGDFSFSLSDVAFGLCPTAERAHFESLVSHTFPFVDPNDNIATIKDELRKWPSLKDLK